MASSIEYLERAPLKEAELADDTDLEVAQVADAQRDGWLHPHPVQPREVLAPGGGFPRWGPWLPAACLLACGTCLLALRAAGGVESKDKPQGWNAVSKGRVTGELSKVAGHGVAKDEPEVFDASLEGGAESGEDVQVPYDFVGEGNCKPNRPQWARRATPFGQCQAVCDRALSCIGFDWDAKWSFCRVRFATDAAAAGPPHGFELLPGVEGGRVRGQSAIAGIEGSHTAACYQKASTVPFQELLSSPVLDGAGRAQVGPLPSIFEYYERVGLVGLRRRARRGGLRVPRDKKVLLAYNGTEGAMILPSLDARPLLKALGRDVLASITIKVGVNSDSYNYGLGIAVEASPQINETEEHREDEYIYNGYGVTFRRNVIKFHPDMSAGELRIEGPGGFDDTRVGFEPPGWTTSHGRLNTLEVTTRTNGTNEVALKSASGHGEYNARWEHKLFDGRDIPTVYAFMDLGGEPGKPLFVGPVFLEVKD